MDISKGNATFDPSWTKWRITNTDFYNNATETWVDRVHHVEETTDSFTQDQDLQNFELADQVIDACLVELNLLETPSQTASWYLDSGATHHVSGDSSAFSSIYPTSGTHIRSCIMHV